jgi:hypothetical protein
MELKATTFLGAFCPERFNAITAARPKEKGMNDYCKIRRQDAPRLQLRHTALHRAESRLVPETASELIERGFSCGA